MDSPPASHPNRTSPFVIGLTIAAIVVVFVIVWAKAIGRPFVDDDWAYLNTIQQPGWWHSSEIWSPSRGLYRPVLFVWFGLLHSVAGLHPLPYHLATAAVALLVGVLTWRIGVAAGLHYGALVAGAVVLLSPVVEYSVSWTAAASSPISVAFALGAILVLVGRPTTVPRSIAAALLLLLGLLTREVVIVAPTAVIAIGWARPGGTLRDGFRRSIPLWIADVAYLILRSASGARNPPGPYHLGFNSKVLTNAFSLIARTADLPVGSFHLRDLASGVLWLLIGAMIYWAVLHRRRVVLAGLVWFAIGLLPVILLVNHAPEPYYIDFALPGLAIAIGAAFEQIADPLPKKYAIAIGIVLVLALGLVGRAYSEFQYTREMGGDITATQRVVDQVDAAYRSRPSGPELIVVHDDHSARVQNSVTSDGNLFRVKFHDPSLQVRFEP